MGKEVSLKIEKIFKICLYIQTETDYCVFFDMSGHVKWIEISIRESKKNYTKELFKWTISLEYSDKETLEDLNELEKKIELFLSGSLPL